MTLPLLLGALCLACSAGLVFVLALRLGQFDDLEDVRFQIFKEDGDRPVGAPDRHNG